MATYWHFVNKSELAGKIEEIKKEFTDVSVVQAEFIVKNEGAFLKIGNKEDAENILLHQTLVIWGDKIEEGYESKLKTIDFSHGVFITAESKTADIEKKLISGVHGAKECHFVVVQSV